MPGSVSRGAAVVLSGSALALAGAMLPAQAATTGWRAAAIVSIKGREVLMSGVDAVTGGDAWAAGFAATASGKKPAGLIEHWAGRSWQAVKLPAKVAKTWASRGPSDVVIGASSATSVWAVEQFPGGANGSDDFLRLSGRSWTVGALPDSSSEGGHLVLVTSVQVIGKSDTWVFGGKVDASTSGLSFVPYAARFNGKRWAIAKVPGNGEITAVSAVSASNMWAVTGTSGVGQEIAGGGSGAGVTSAVLHWNGKSWQKAAVQPAGLPTGGDLTSVTATAKQVWIGGDVATSAGGTAVQFVDQFAGGKWSAPTDLPKSGASAGASGHLPYQIESLVPAGTGSYWALSGNLGPVAPMLWHYSGGKWSAQSSPRFGNASRVLLQLSAVPGGRSVWAVGTVGRTSTAKGLIALNGQTPR